jgi:hypothetical protein
MFHRVQSASVRVVTSDQMLEELVGAVCELLAELDEARAHSECGECPPTVATEDRLRAAIAAFVPG